MQTNVPTADNANCGIYVIEFDNGKTYVGQSMELSTRVKRHGYAAQAGRGSLVHKAMRKHGYKVRVVANCCVDELTSLEDELIGQFNAMAPNGYNLRTGDKHGPLTEQHRENMSKARKGKPMSPEAYAAYRAGRKTMQWTDAGRAAVAAARRVAPMSDEQKQKISAAHKGRPKSEETKANMRRAQLLRAEQTRGTPRKPHSAETRAKIGAANSVALKGKKLPAETREKLSAALRERYSTQESRDAHGARMKEVWAQRKALKALNSALVPAK
jgi:group I intron endonuclease